MSVKKILNQHFKVIFNDKGERSCQCGFYLGNHDGMSKRHNKHAIAVLEQHMQEREAQAWEDCSDAWQDALNQDRFNPEEHLPPNPYRKESSDGC